MSENTQQNSGSFSIEGTATGRLLSDSTLFSFETRQVLNQNMSWLFAQAVDTMHSIYDVASGDLIPYQQDRFLEASTRLARARRSAVHVVNGASSELDVAGRVYLASALNWSASELLATSSLSVSSELRVAIYDAVLELLDGLPFSEEFTDFRLGPSLLSQIAYDIAKTRGFSGKEASRAVDLAYLMITDNDDACADVGLTLRGAVEVITC